MEYIDDLLKVLKNNNDIYDIDKIKRAYYRAEAAHKEQLRKSGDPYITHPVAVAIILADLGMDTDTLTAALLHDVVEDTEVTIDEIKKEFGDDTALLVDGMTKLRKIPFSSQEEQQAENIRKMLMAMAQDVRVIIIKLADRLHNMRTIDFKPPDKRRATALETMEVFAPMAHRLGIRTIKEELEDISLQYLDPVGYREIEQLLNLEKDDREDFLESIRCQISERLGDYYEDMVIDGRVKNIYGIYRKMYMQNNTFDEIYDIYAVRVIVNTIAECYNVLGEIHDMFRPLPNRFKDYISTPKPNRYQSLHTTLIDERAVPFEVQIRTWEMHHTAEYGIAAHWKYKEGIHGKDSLEEKIAWVRQILETQKTAVDAQELLGTIKTDLSTDEVFAFTPKGDVISLPVGSTVVDFAYAIHSEVGNSMVGAKIDGRMVSLETEIQTGSIVNILTSNAPGRGPSRDWLKIVKTGSTRNKIRSWFRRERKEENIEQGRAELEKSMKRQKIILSSEDEQEFLEIISRKQRLNSVDELLAAIGYGGINLTTLMPKVRELYQKEYKTTEEEELQEQLKLATGKSKRKASSGVIVEGMDDCLVKFAKCCNPLPGDDIIGFITRGFGVSVHKMDCVNVNKDSDIEEERARWVDCSWANDTHGEVFKSTIDITAQDRSGLLIDVSMSLNSMRLPVYALLAKEMPDNITEIQITFGVPDIGQLDYAIKTLRKIDGVINIKRTIK